MDKDATEKKLQNETGRHIINSLKGKRWGGVVEEKETCECIVRCTAHIILVSLCLNRGLCKCNLLFNHPSASTASSYGIEKVFK